MRFLNLAKLKNPKEMLKTAFLGFAIKVGLVSGLFLLALITITIALSDDEQMTRRTPIHCMANISEEVMEWQDVVESYAYHYEIESWSWTLLAIMQVESRGLVPDLMQSSESAGLSVNTLEYEESIAQGVRYLARIIERAESLEIYDDHDGILQAYNFGIAYLNWLAYHGLRHGVEVASYYSRTVVAPSLGNTTGERYDYINEVSLRNGKPWLYVSGGNFHYADLVNSHLCGDVTTPLYYPFVITSPYGPRWGTHHAGIDLASYFGAVVRSVKDGRVIRVVNHFDSDGGFLGHPGGWGNLVMIEHEGGITTLYAHLTRDVLVEVGDEVRIGEHIGHQGNSGSSTGTHLHFEWWEDGVPINPELRINFRNHNLARRED